MDSQEEISEAVEAFLEDTWEEEPGEPDDPSFDEPDEHEDPFLDMTDDFFDGVLEEDLNDSTASTDPSPNLEEEEDVLPPGVPPPSDEHIKVLQNYFGHSSFRPMQWKIIHAVMQKQDNCVVMATGYGKSLCFQFPSVYQKGVTVVVSPLISLMQDQVLGLQALNIPACFLGSGQTKKGEVYYEMFQGEYRLVYVTPEFIEACVDVLKDLMNKVGIMMFAIDEAHCLSQWGHDFRSSYRKLGAIRKNFPGVPILAVTATATQRVQKDICSVLRLRNPVVTVTSFDRPNLYIEAKPKSKSILDDILPLMTKDSKGKYHPDGPTIVYCPTRKATEEVNLELRRAGLQCEVYHAGMTPKQRESAHHKFVRDKVDIIVATVAFGMGINKPDVRRVIHYGAPGSPESYYQEIGRAGRDGLPSTCTVFYAPGDSNSHRYFIGQIKSEEFQRHQIAMLKKITDFLNDNVTCRRASIIAHFTSKLDKQPPRRGCCDNCTNKLEGKRSNMGTARVNAALNDQGEFDFTADAKKLLETSQRCPNCTTNSLVSILRGLKNQRVKPHWMKFPTYSKGKDRNEAYWKELVQMLVRSEYLSENLVRCDQSWGRGRGRGWGRGGGTPTFSYTAIDMSEKGYQTLADPNAKICLTPSTIMMDQLRYVVKRTVPDAEGDASTITTKPLHRMFNPRDFIFQPTNGSIAKQSSLPSPQRAPPPAVPGIVSPVKPTRGGAEKELQKRETDNASAFANEKDDPEKIELLMELYKSLLELRNCVADETNYMPYLVATNKTILVLTQQRPTTLAGLRSIEGMGEAKIAKFGPYFISHIRSYCKEHKLNCQEFEEDPKYSSDNQDWSFKKTPFGWRFRRHSAAPLIEAPSSGWLSKPRPAMVSSTVNQPGSSGELDAPEGKAAETSNMNREKQKSSYSSGTGNKGVSCDDDFDHLFEEEQVDFTKTLRRDETQRDSENYTESKIKKENSTIPKSLTAVSEDDDFDHILEEEPVDFTSTLRVEASSHKENNSQGAKNINVSYSSSSEHKVHGSVPSLTARLSRKGKVEEEGREASTPLSSSDITQAHEANLTEMFSYKPKEKKGVQFSEPDSETQKNTSGNKYEQILLRKRESKESGWIDARKMKKKLKSAFSK